MKKIDRLELSCYFDRGVKLLHGDCLELMKDIPDKSIDLIVNDPPYNIKKAEWDNIKNYIQWCGLWLKECERVLKNNGSFYFFHNDFLQIVDLQKWIGENTRFVFKSFITWDKTKFKKYAWANRNPEKCMDRNWFPNVEYILYYTFQDETGLTTVMLDTNNFSTLRKYFKGLQEYINLNIKQINTKLNHRKSEHCFYWKTTQWDLPTAETYQELIDNFNINKWEGFREYESLRQEYESLRQEYESLRYTFNLKEVQENISCVWNSKENNSGKNHSCQKPTDIIMKIINTSSNENDVVLDCFMGSGSTGVACKNLNRNFIGIEKDDKYFKIAKDRIDNL